MKKAVLLCCMLCTLTAMAQQTSRKLVNAELHRGDSRLFSEKTSPFSRTFQICYSKDPDFSTYSFAQINCYIHEIIAVYYPENYEYDILRSRHLILGDDEYSITSWLPLY